ncbi:MAG TPA: TIGR03435 family protein [Verrucomicrobiae bacterium]|nr:TIGR03435 family protein [Verrucomicrobiae bacterium]
MKFRGIALSFFLVALVAAAFGQKQPAHPEFEVASVKPAAPLVDRVSIGIHVDGAQVHITDYSLADFIRIAYRVKNYQVTGPDSLSDRFDIHAKLPEGATRDQVPEMLQSLLASRFELKLHRDTKEFPVYNLVSVGSDKLKQTAEPLPEDTGGRGGSVDVEVQGGRNGTFANLPGGAGFSFSNNKLVVTKISMASLVDLLGRFLERPVVDKTGLQGGYDMSIDLTPEDYMAMQIRAAISAGVTLPPEALRFLQGATDESLHNGLRSYGLKLETGKAPLEVLVVDHISKTPSEN